MFSNRRLERDLYIAGWVFAAISLLWIMIFALTPLDISDIVPNCYVHRITGLYCPGCGGTRAVVAFIQGHLLKSLYYHPFVPYCGFLYIIYMFRGTLAVFLKNESLYMKFRLGYIYFGIVIILAQWLFKDILLIVYNYAWLG